MTTTILRTIIIYIFVVFILRLMGKRQIGELEASELVVTIIISEIAALPISNPEISSVKIAVAILSLMLMEILFSHLAYKYIPLRTLLYGKPSMFVEKGKLNQQEMKKQRFNIADLMEELRNNGAISLSQVDYVIMETNGKVSVILNSQNSPVTPGNMNLKPQPPAMSYVIIDNGNLIKPNLKRLNLSQKWLEKQLKTHNLNKISQVFYLSYEQSSGKTVLIPKEGANKS